MRTDDVNMAIRWKFKIAKVVKKLIRQLATGSRQSLSQRSNEVAEPLWHVTERSSDLKRFCDTMNLVKRACIKDMNNKNAAERENNMIDKILTK